MMTALLKQAINQHTACQMQSCGAVASNNAVTRDNKQKTAITLLATVNNYHHTNTPHKHCVARTFGWP
jgi:hypothetical protein